MPPLEFEELRLLINGYFHQDMDINGDTIEAIVGVYLNDADLQQRAGLLVDIQRFLGKHEDDQQLTDDFMRTFRPDLTDQPWGLTIRQFLLRIEQILTQSASISERELSPR